MGRKKNTQLTQTTCVTLFVPSFIVVALPVVYFVDIQPIYNKTLVMVSINKKNTKKRKKLTVAQTTHLASFGPVFAVVTFPVTYFVDIQPICE